MIMNLLNWDNSSNFVFVLLHFASCKELFRIWLSQIFKKVIFSFWKNSFHRLGVVTALSNWASLFFVLFSIFLFLLRVHHLGNTFWNRHEWICWASTVLRIATPSFTSDYRTLSVNIFWALTKAASRTLSVDVIIVLATIALTILRF